MVILKRWKDSDEWFEVSLEHCIDKLVSEHLSKEDALETLEQGSALQTIAAWYKKK